MCFFVRFLTGKDGVCPSLGKQKFLVNEQALDYLVDMPYDITIALQEQVYSAMPKGGCEADVLTTITQPMWSAFLEEINEKTTQLPKKGLSVWGSVTHVVPSKKMYSFSRRMIDS